MIKSVWSILWLKMSQVCAPSFLENRLVEFFTFILKETGKMRERDNHSHEEGIQSTQSAFLLHLELCWDHLYPYLSNNDLCKLDSALTEKRLRRSYFRQLERFYTVNSIFSDHELEWIIKRDIRLTVCRLEFDYSNAIEHSK